MNLFLPLYILVLSFLSRPLLADHGGEGDIAGGGSLYCIGHQSKYRYIPFDVLSAMQTLNLTLEEFIAFADQKFANKSCTDILWNIHSRMTHHQKKSFGLFIQDRKSKDAKNGRQWIPLRRGLKNLNDEDRSLNIIECSEKNQTIRRDNTYYTDPSKRGKSSILRKYYYDKDVLLHLEQKAPPIFCSMLYFHEWLRDDYQDIHKIYQENMKWHRLIP
jgi:hypothetical protein